MSDAAAGAGLLPGLTARLRQFTPGSDIGLAFGVVLLLSVLILPLPTLLLDLGLALSITASVLVLMVALFLSRPLDFSSFPTLLLLTTLLRLSLNVATTRMILSHGNEGPLAAGHVVAAFGGFLMGGDVVIGLIIFCILLVVNFMVITKGSGRIAEVAARFSLDAMPGKQMAIDADLSAGLIDEKAGARGGGASWRRRAVSTARWTARRNSSAAMRSRPDHHRDQHPRRPGDRAAAARHVVRRRGRHLHHADRRRWPGVADSCAAGVHRGRHRGDQGRHGRHRGRGADPAAGQQPEAAGHGGRRGDRAGAAARPAGAAVPGAGRACRRRRVAAPQASGGPAGRTAVRRLAERTADQRGAAHRHDPPGARLRPAGAGRRRYAAADRADQGPAPVHRRRDGLRAAAGAHPGQHAVGRRQLLDADQGDRGRPSGELRTTMLLAMDPKGERAGAAGRAHAGAGVRPAGAVDRPGQQGRRRCSAAAPWSTRRAC